ncbi:MAG: flagellin FliC5 [Lachnospiraceae bacterium]|nr:flagellin FliC5 [Lachnospiraceae bacterium]MBP5555074.1 flagellin FliC5 [Lachnospiraceae bacterium]MBP5701351.1 flagellin FliC5 [Lachnospiraceae bacterium]MBP5761679.1 flagellin FliC5 [Lachnospiraceae bacterium]
MSSISGVSSYGYNSLYGKIASGKSLQSAADGAAELAISEKMNAQVGGLEQGADNVSSGIDAIRIQDSALGDVTDYLQRIRELALAASNTFTISDEDKKIYQQEISQLKEGIEDVSKITSYNEKNLLDGSSKEMEIATDSNASSVSVSGMDSTLKALGIEDFDVTKDFNIEDIDKALDTVSKMRSDAGAKMNSLEHAYNINKTSSYNLTAADSRLEDLDMEKAVSKLDKQRLLDTINVMMQKKKEENEARRAQGLFS